MKNDHEFVWKLTSEGIAYSLTNYFSEKDIQEIQDPELKEVVLAAQQALVKLDHIIDSKYSEDVA